MSPTSPLWCKAKTADEPPLHSACGVRAQRSQTAELYIPCALWGTEVGRFTEKLGKLCKYTHQNPHLGSMLEASGNHCITETAATVEWLTAARCIWFMLWEGYHPTAPVQDHCIKPRYSGIAWGQECSL
ncbi:hypothetical protein KIL84_013694 [Mauremys mutica]|uniref:Uncharacterized protein n=1 Tax=Mauremys mutica TaxID=74926 RepID=A0A9D3WRS0_9SAUR|nr:hypothetical protein KIL84_013694 [Mauremys mutica]